jgi:hypothetical protein
MGFNLNQGGLIYDEMLTYRRFPEGLFEGSDQRKQMVRILIEPSKSSK